MQTAGRIVGCACRTPPYRLVVSRLPLAAVGDLATDVGNVFDSLNGVTGPTAEAEAFADTWTARRGGSWKTRFRLRAHVLRRVTPSGDTSGALRKAEQGELALVREWLEAYVRDTGIDPLGGNAAERMVGQGSVYLWVDGGGARAMVGKGRETANGCAIYGVYTPPRWRRRGYATAAVAALSELALKRGQLFCCLYTDASNATTNSIYAKIGYEPIRDDTEITFEG